MELTIKTLENANEKAWNDLVESSPHGTIFHTVEWLRLVQEHTNAELLPLMFYKGSQLVAVYPIFIQKHGVIKVALSPPSRSYMLYLGPVIGDYESLKQDKKESNYIHVQQEMDNYIFGIKKCKYARIRSSPGLYDSRPLQWSGYTVVPYYTYRIDLTIGLDRVWEQFDKPVRRNINQSQQEGLTVRSGDKEDLEFIHDSLYKRYIEQGINPRDNKKYLLTIYQKFYPDNLKIFVVEYEGKRVGGTINLCYKNNLYAWVGMPKTNLAGKSPNELLRWEVIKWAQTNGFNYYEMMDAGDDPRLRHFKSKFNPDLVVWYSATKYSSFVYKMVENFFNILKKRGI